MQNQDGSAPLGHRASVQCTACVTERDTRKPALKKRRGNHVVALVYNMKTRVYIHGSNFWEILSSVWMVLECCGGGEGVGQGQLFH